MFKKLSQFIEHKETKDNATFSIDKPGSQYKILDRRSFIKVLSYSAFGCITQMLTSKSARAIIPFGFIRKQPSLKPTFYLFGGASDEGGANMALDSGNNLYFGSNTSSAPPASFYNDLEMIKFNNVPNNYNKM